MDRVGVFVDAGYLFAQGSVESCGRKLARGETILDHGAAVAALKTFAEDRSRLPLLRIYWYDGTSQGPTSQHIALAEQAGVKVRLGFVNSVDEADVVTARHGVRSFTRPPDAAAGRGSAAARLGSRRPMSYAVLGG